MSAPRELTRCTCTKYPGRPCHEQAAQEDFLCDGCRGGVPGEGQVLHVVTGCGALARDGTEIAWHVAPFTLQRKPAGTR